MQKFYTILFFVVWLILTKPLFAQPASLHFKQLTVSQGLNDGLVTSICEDKYGFMWFATLGGLNRYNGYSMQLYSHVPGDSTTPLGSLVECMATDSSGRLWIGFEAGLMEYQFDKGIFKQVNTGGNLWVNGILAASQTQIFLATGRGLALLNPGKMSVRYLASNNNDTAQQKLLNARMMTITKYKDYLYIGSSIGMLRYDIRLNNIEKVVLPGIDPMSARHVAVDGNGDIWVSGTGQAVLAKLDSKGNIVTYNQLFPHSPFALFNNINGQFTNKKGDIFIITSVDGLLHYSHVTREIIQYKMQPGMPGSLSDNLVRSIYEDRNGLIWLGGNHGLNYCNPEKKFFSVLMPFADSMDVRNRRFGRGLAVDSLGQWWMATADGISKYTPTTNKYYTWRNVAGKPPVIYYNSARAVVEDEHKNIWIATGHGINRYSYGNKQMEFIPNELLPNVFYFSANKDRRGRIWFGCRDLDGFYWYDPANNSYHSIAEHAQMQQLKGKGGRYFFEDSKGRYWFGFNGNGVGMYDSATKTVKEWNTSMPKDSTVIGDMVIDIEEDKNGVIWVSTNNGITGIDVGRNKFTSFNKQNGLLSNTASALGVDSVNRLWIATARGLNMLDCDRVNFTSFTTQDGLPSDEFPEHPGITLANGDFVFPNSNGYVRFNPNAYKPNDKQVSVYLSGVKVQNKDFAVPGEITALAKLQLAYYQNAFTLFFAAPNYENPAQTWFAYQLDGFDKNWVYTQNNEINYTNVPGGRYVFRYKVSTDPNHWGQSEKQIIISIDTVFYKTIWFISLMTLLTAGFLYWLYQNRLQQQRQLLDLQSKAKLLEKEKAMVMYENLKQHLNPHFLFNSLTSLSSLIRLDQEMAGDFLEKMSKTYRYILKNRDSETVSLLDELNFVSLYIVLQQTRFEEALQVNITVQEEYYYRGIAPVTLQNLVENAIKHNMLGKNKPLVINIFVANNYLVIQNNLQKKNFVETSNKQGLQSMRSLYKYLTDQPVLIEESSDYFIVRIPLI